MKKIILLVSCFSLLYACNSNKSKKENNEVETENSNQALIAEFETAADKDLLKKWYPLVIDKEDGGYYSQVTHDFKLGEEHNKMVVTQARHIWTNAKASKRNQEDSSYLKNAAHGFEFMRDIMWDEENGGFHNLVNKSGEPIIKKGEAKTAYGNSFAIYGLAAYYDASGNEEALDLAKKTFRWLEEHSHDKKFKGYFQHLEMNGTPVIRTAEMASTSDIGYKDQNSSIHLLEAFTELYRVWPNDLVGERLEELLLIIRDTIVNDDDYMNLFFERDWTPVSFKENSKEEIKKHYYLDHISPGHDVETAFLMLDASEALGLKNDSLTLQTAKKMVDHSLETGWDKEVGGFYDGGYYFEGEDEITTVNDKKNWWAQAEGLNTLLIMAEKFPEDETNYRKYFNELWSYTKTYMMDQEQGGWYEWGIDKTPDAKTALKGHIWKATYHNYRALSHVADRLREMK